jgi:Protein of unknown function (DUF3352)
MRRGLAIRLALIALALAAAALLAACGSSSSSSSSTGPDPASVVPADAPVYGDFVVKPEGDQKDAVESFLQKVTGGQDVGSLIVQKLDQALAQDDLTYEDDIQPWLGSDVGAFATKLGSQSASGAAVVSTSDPDAAMSTLETAAKNSPEDGKLTSATYQGVDYDVQGTTAFGPVGDFIVVGTDDAFKAAVDTSAGGDSLADSSAYTTAIANAPGDALVTGYADPRAIVQAIVDSGGLPAAQADAILKQVGATGGGSVAAWLDATSSSAGLTVSAPAPANAPSSDSSSPLAGLPDDAWLAFGAANVGESFTQGIRQLQSFSNSGLNGPEGLMLRRFTALTRVDLQNIGRWLGDVSGFMSGTGLLSLSGALVLVTKDENASQQTISEFERLFRKDADVTTRPLPAGQTGFSIQPQGAPIQVIVEQRDGKVVIGLGQDSVDEALSPSSTLGDSDGFKAAASTLGSGLEPSAYLDFQPISSFLKVADASSPNPELEQALPYLDRLDYLIAGASSSSDRVESRVVLGVRDSSDSGSGVESSVLP